MPHPLRASAAAAFTAAVLGLVEALHRGFMASAGHRRNILGDFDRVGVGVTDADGRLWVTVDFVRTS